MPALLGKSATEAPLPPLLPVYRRRFLAVSSAILKGWFCKLELFDEAPETTAHAKGNQVFYSNHPSFWDPLVIARLLEGLLPNHHWFAPIEAGAMRSHWYFRGLGFFPIPTNSAIGLKTFLQVGTAVLKAGHPSALVLTAEGEFQDPWIRPLRLKRGLARLLTQDDLAHIPVRPLGILYGTSESPRQSVTLRLGPPCSMGPDRDTHALHRQLENALELLLDRQLQAGSPRHRTQQSSRNLLEKSWSQKTH